MGNLRDKGFTLIELLVVMVVIGVSVSVIVLRMFPDERELLRKEADRMILLFQFAQHEAARRGEPVGISFDGDRYAFWLQQNAGNWQMYEEEPIFKAGSLANGARFTSILIGQAGNSGSAAKLAFAPNGECPPFVAALALNESFLRIRGDVLCRFSVEEAPGGG
jgi:general secretion pathway protein H